MQEYRNNALHKFEPFTPQVIGLFKTYEEAYEKRFCKINFVKCEL